MLDHPLGQLSPGAVADLRLHDLAQQRPVPAEHEAERESELVAERVRMIHGDVLVMFTQRALRCRRGVKPRGGAAPR